MRPGSVFPTFSKMHRSVVSVSGEKACERQSHVVCGTLGLTTIFHPLDRLASHFVWPRAGFAGRLIRPVKLNHDLVFGSFSKKRLVEIYDFLRFMIEEVDLCSDDTDSIQQLKELPARIRSAKVFTVFPKPRANFLL